MEGRDDVISGQSTQISEKADIRFPVENVIDGPSPEQHVARHRQLHAQEGEAVGRLDPSLEEQGDLLREPVSEPGLETDIGCVLPGPAISNRQLDRGPEVCDDGVVPGHLGVLGPSQTDEEDLWNTLNKHC